jgi:hypothetical protein
MRRRCPRHFSNARLGDRGADGVNSSAWSRTTSAISPTHVRGFIPPSEGQVGAKTAM